MINNQPLGGMSLFFNIRGEYTCPNGVILKIDNFAFLQYERLNGGKSFFETLAEYQSGGLKNIHTTVVSLIHACMLKNMPDATEMDALDILDAYPTAFDDLCLSSMPNSEDVATKDEVTEGTTKKKPRATRK